MQVACATSVAYGVTCCSARSHTAAFVVVDRPRDAADTPSLVDVDFPDKLVRWPAVRRLPFAPEAFLPLRGFDVFLLGLVVPRLFVCSLRLSFSGILDEAVHAPLLDVVVRLDVPSDAPP